MRFLEEAASQGLSRIKPLDQMAVGKKLSLSQSEMSDAVRSLKAEKLIEYKPASESFAVTNLGIEVVEERKAERKRLNAPGSKVDDPLPDTLTAVQAEIARWETRQYEGAPGSDWWKQVDARLQGLRHKEQRLLATEQPLATTTINNYAPGARTYTHQSQDHSINFIGENTEAVFSQVRQEITKLVPEAEPREAILERLNEVKDATTGHTRMERYNQFMAAASNHVTVLAPVLTPLLQWLVAGHYFG